MFSKIKIENDRIYKKTNCSEMKSEVFTEYTKPEQTNRSYFSVSDNTEKITTIGCVLKYSAHNKVLALNFANAMFPGGAYVLGGNAQEESLCRASMLYYTIKTQKKYYIRNRMHILPDYTDTLIYSKNVRIIRDDSGNLLEVPLISDFITIPAVNRSFAKFIFSDRKINEKMRRRIEMLLSIAVSKNPDVLILGAFGCGVFGNKREYVLSVFEEMINEFVPESIKIVFALPD